jgi:peptidyl-prolyl cis-trans isomerase B (cyclophilin B)
VTPKDRERAYEKRRYEEWQTRLMEKRAQNRRLRQRLAIGGGSVVVVLVIVAAFFLVSQRGDDDDATTTASSTPSASADPATTTAAAASTAKSTCPTVDVKAPAKPKQFAKAPAKTLADGKTWTWTLKTTCGDIPITLDGAKAPQAVSAMIQLTKDGFFNGTPCHRLTGETSGIYVLQCGDPTGTGTGGPGYTYGPLENVPSDAVYPAGTVAMARGTAEDSQGSQFFLVYKDSTIGTKGAPGYSVIGQMSAEGLAVVTKVAKGGDDESNSAGGGKPNSAVSIRTASVKE